MHIHNSFFFKILLIALIIQPYSEIASQNLTDVIFFAEKLFENKNYNAALNEYRRAYFFSTDDNKYQLSEKITDCYIASENIPQAKNFCDTAYLYATCDSTRAESFLKKTACIILEKQYGDALTLLQKTNLGFNIHLENKKQILAGIACLGLNDFNTAYNYLKIAAGDNDTEISEKLHKLLANNKNINRPLPLLAGGMSAMLPGSGQMYAGEFTEGLNSIALLAGITGLTYVFPAARLLFMSMLVRYYTGGLSRAFRYADTKRETNRLETTNDVLQLYSGTDIFRKQINTEKEFYSFRKFAFDSEGEIPILISGAFLLYKKILSAQDVDACVFTPTCSVYMMETIRKNGIIKGLLDGTDRLLRCHGFAGHNHYHVCKTTGKLYDAP